MNASQFIKERGVGKAREELNKLPNSNVTHMTSDARMFIDENNPLLDEFQRSQIRDLICIKELKHLVESVDLINSLGGVQEATNKAFDMTMLVVGFNPDKIEQAIADYGKIFGGEHV